MYSILRRPKAGGDWVAVRDYKRHDDAAKACERYRTATKRFHYLVGDERFCPWMPVRLEAG